MPSKKKTPWWKTTTAIVLYVVAAVMAVAGAVWAWAFKSDDAGSGGGGGDGVGESTRTTLPQLLGGASDVVDSAKDLLSGDESKIGSALNDGLDKLGAALESGKAGAGKLGSALTSIFGK